MWKSGNQEPSRLRLLPVFLISTFFSWLLQKPAIPEPFDEAVGPAAHGEGALAHAETVAAGVVEVQLGVHASLAQGGEQARELIGHPIVVGAREEGGRGRLL